MKRYNIPFENSGKSIDEILFKFQFYESAREARKNAVDSEKILEIKIIDEFIDNLITLPHMIVVKDKNRGKDLLRYEKIFKDYKTAQRAYNKNNLNIGFADILPISEVNELDSHGKIRIYEALI
ncbi:MAG: hypothetical protein V1660_03280 [archaeon]